ncbi:MAG: hypothetical protein KGN16_07735 [Burkholderiales bacterium]|nr:hypothetical protein [Burkholderiales bacterium]
MEERVGIWWHRIVTRWAATEHRDAAVELTTMSDELGLLFRALGGAHGLRIDAAAARRHGARRGWADRLAGTRLRVAQAACDEESLRLPPTLAIYPERALNRALYRWLAALAAVAPAASAGGHWAQRNLLGSRWLIERYAGLAQDYRRLAAAEVARRPLPEALPPDEARFEAALRSAIADPAQEIAWPPLRRAPQPVPLWLGPDVLLRGAAAAPPPEAEGATAAPTLQDDRQRRQAESAQAPERGGGLLIFRPESIFSWTEYARVRHEVQDNDDEDLARAADDLDLISVGNDGRAVAKALRMNLDRAAGADDPGVAAPQAVPVPEWDYRSRRLLEGHCAVVIRAPANADAIELPTHLRADQRRLQHRLSALAPQRQTLRRQPQGDEIDLDACIRGRVEPGAAMEDCYRTVRRRRRDLACLLLADLSLSTEASLADGRRVIDVIRDSLHLFGVSLAVTGDRSAIYGFSSRRRMDVQLSELKRFDQPYDGAARGRVERIAPAHYTRMGAAVRRATALLAAEPCEQRLLLLLTDGKPNDVDHYEGRYGIEDTHHALHAARRAGLHPFCITVDSHGQDYLPRIFGPGGYAVVRRPAELPERLAGLYAQLTRSLH